VTNAWWLILKTHQHQNRVEPMEFDEDQPRTAEKFGEQGWINDGRRMYREQGKAARAVDLMVVLLSSARHDLSAKSGASTPASDASAA
jgi:hypothetical protein